MAEERPRKPWQREASRMVVPICHAVPSIPWREIFYVSRPRWQSGRAGVKIQVLVRKGAVDLIPVQLYIESTIHAEGEEPEVIRQQLAGRLQIKDEEWVLRYTENTGTADEVRTSVKSLPDQITVVRQGPVSYRQTYRPGETTESIVHTPAGKTEMDVTTLKYFRERTGEEGLIQFSFLLNMGAQDLGRYQLIIRWTEATSE
jgi:uncharacterized beta-barrel protein YwiB (DUF1934 family)